MALAIVASVVVLAGLGVVLGVTVLGKPAARTTVLPPTPSPTPATPVATLPAVTSPTTDGGATAGLVPVSANVSSTDPAPFEQTLGRYFAALDQGDWQAAWATFSPAEQAKVSPAQIAQGATGAHDSAVVIEDITANADGSQVATVSFQSTQPLSDSPNDSACDDWDLSYTMVQGGAGLLIDKVNPVTNPPYSAC